MSEKVDKATKEAFQQFLNEEKTKKTKGTIIEVNKGTLKQFATEQMQAFRSYDNDKDKPTYEIVIETGNETIRRTLVLKHANNSNYKQFVQKYGGDPKPDMIVELILSSGGAWKLDL